LTFRIKKAAQPRVNLTRLSLRSSLREGAAKHPCQQGFGPLSPGRLRHRWAAKIAKELNPRDNLSRSEANDVNME